jgi:hypothetical protein
MHHDVGGIGVLALVIGLWLALPAEQSEGQDGPIVALGWALASAAGVLILTTLLTLPINPVSAGDSMSPGSSRSEPGGGSASSGGSAYSTVRFTDNQGVVIQPNGG